MKLQRNSILSSDEVKTRLTKMKRKGVLRQLSAIFDTRKLGYTSSLVAMEIDEERVRKSCSTHKQTSRSES